VFPACPAAGISQNGLLQMGSFCQKKEGKSSTGAMTSWCTIQCHQVVLVVELVEASTLSTLSPER
jgi:hypothetical protein